MRIFNINNPDLTTMDTKHRDRYRITKTQPHGKGEKKRFQASENDSDAQHEPQAPSPNDKPPSEASQGDDAANDSDYDDDPHLQDSRPIMQNYNLLRILPTVEISRDPTLSIRNPREIGPQSDICARVPGCFNHWAASVSCYDSFYDLWDLMVMHSGADSPEVHFYQVHFYLVGSGVRSTYERSSVARLLLLDEPTSIIAWTNDPGHDAEVSQMTVARTVRFSTAPPLPCIQHVLGDRGSKWLV